jgi:SDR family mycofactocin-dependent oxidoreductase
MGKLDGKVAIVTGAARGQGRSHSETFAREGADIVAIDICEPTGRELPYELATQADLDETVARVEALGPRCLGVKADVRDSAQMDAAVERVVAELGRIDIVIANAGICTAQRWDGVDDEVWDQTLATNLTGVWRTIRPTIPHMIEAGGGAVVMTSSMAALRGQPGELPYSTAKAGLFGLMQTLSAELAPNMIRVNTISPGNTASPMFHAQQFVDMFVGHENATLEELKFPSGAMTMMPIPWIEAQDVSNALLFLVSEEGRYITGINLSVDGGSFNQPPGIPPAAATRIAELEWELEHRDEKAAAEAAKAS